MTKLSKISAKKFGVLISLLVLLAGFDVQGQELFDESKYTITGYSFDYDAISETDGRLLLETSRFKPLMITNSTSDIFGDDPFGTNLTGAPGTYTPRGFAIAAEYLATPDLAFLGAIGVTRGSWNDTASLEAESSWEANLGIVYNLFNSLSYEIHFGYMDTGDLFEQSSSYSEVDSIIMISNQLTLSF